MAESFLKWAFLLKSFMVFKIMYIPEMATKVHVKMQCVKTDTK